MVAAITEKGRATRDRILAAAASLMAERGVAGTSVGDVQQAAGVSASQLYHYFGDKETLVRAVIRAQIDAVLGEMPPGGLGSFEALTRWRDGLVSDLARRGCVGGCRLGTLAGELVEVSPQLRRDLAAGFGRWEAAVRDGLRAMYWRGDLVPSADPDRLAVMLLAAVEGGMLLAQLRRDPAALAVAMDAVLEYVGTFRP